VIVPRFEMNGDVTRSAWLSNVSSRLPEAPFILDRDRLPLVTKNGHQSGHQDTSFANDVSICGPTRATITARAAMGPQGAGCVSSVSRASATVVVALEARDLLPHVLDDDINSLLVHTALIVRARYLLLESIDLLR